MTKRRSINKKATSEDWVAFALLVGPRGLERGRKII